MGTHLHQPKGRPAPEDAVADASGPQPVGDALSCRRTDRGCQPKADGGHGARRRGARNVARISYVRAVEVWRLEHLLGLGLQSHAVRHKTRLLGIEGLACARGIEHEANAGRPRHHLAEQGYSLRAQFRRDTGHALEAWPTPRAGGRGAGHRNVARSRDTETWLGRHRFSQNDSEDLGRIRVAISYLSTEAGHRARSRQACVHQPATIRRTDAVQFPHGPEGIDHEQHL
jgi:hypothetical protein